MKSQLQRIQKKFCGDNFSWKRRAFFSSLGRASHSISKTFFSCQYALPTFSPFKLKRTSALMNNYQTCTVWPAHAMYLWAKKKKIEDRILQTNFHLIWKGFVLFVFRLGLNISLHSPTVLINHKGNLTSLRNVSLVPTTSYVLIPSVLRVKTGMVSPTFLHIQRINHWYRFTSVNTRSFQIIFERCMPGRK